MAGRSEIKTMFEFIDVDEGRSLPMRSASNARLQPLRRARGLSYALGVAPIGFGGGGGCVR